MFDFENRIKAMFDLKQKGNRLCSIDNAGFISRVFRTDEIIFCGVIWSDVPTPPRWLSASECLAVQDFRTFAPGQHPSCMPVQTSFTLPCPGRSVAKARAQAGNSMHVNCVGIALLYSFSVSFICCSNSLIRLDNSSISDRVSFCLSSMASLRS